MSVRLLAAAAVFATASVFAQDAAVTTVAIKAPNVIAVSPTIVTSGQPNAQSLNTLAAQGFKAVIYLAPPTVSDAVPQEGDIVRSQGMEFINIPINFGEPTDADFKEFVQAMNRLRGQKVLVHCQVNMRASTFTFLYRAIELHEPPEQAWDAVTRVWSPRGAWRRLAEKELKQAGIAFEPY